MKRTWSVELQDRIGEGETERVRGLVRDACSMYREVLIHRARYLLQQGGLKAHRESWIPIASLYQLRQIVGGRFSSLRERWLNAGFSLLNRDGVLEERQDSDGKGWLTITSQRI